MEGREGACCWFIWFYLFFLNGFIFWVVRIRGERQRLKIYEEEGTMNTGSNPKAEVNKGQMAGHFFFQKRKEEDKEEEKWVYLYLWG